MASDRGKDILTVLIVILVGLGSFELGRLSKASQSSGVKIEYLGEQSGDVLGVQANQSNQSVTKSNQLTQVKSTSNSIGKAYFASSRGNKYYHLGCSGGKTLKPENKIYFATAEEAEKAGYELSTTCK